MGICSSCAASSFAEAIQIQFIILLQQGKWFANSVYMVLSYAVTFSHLTEILQKKYY